MNSSFFYSLFRSYRISFKQQFSTVMLWIIVGSMSSRAAIPIISEVTPNAGPIGSTVSIVGENFSTNTSENVVVFGVVHGEVLSATSTELAVRVPVGAAYTQVTVVVDGLTAYAPDPFILTFTPVGMLDTNTFMPVFEMSSQSTPFPRIADLDGDGHLDITFANYHSGSLSVYRNKGVGGTLSAASFDPRIDFSTGSGPNDSAIGDLDGDGKLDLVVPNDFSSSFSVFHNISTPGVWDTGSFAARVDFPAGNNPVGIRIADIDGDGKPDIVIANAVLGPSTVSIHRNTSTEGIIDGSSFAPGVHFPTGNHSFKLEVGDLDGDGKPDLAVANLDESVVSLLRNTSSPGTIDTNSFALAVSLATPSDPLQVNIADLDGDGRPDLIVGQKEDITVYRNDSTVGSLTTNSFVMVFNDPIGIEYVRVMDMDGDGWPEVNGGIIGEKGIAIYRNLSSPENIQLDSRLEVQNSTQRFDLGDLNGDGRPDIVGGRDRFRGSGIFINQNALPVQTWLAPHAYYTFAGNANDSSGQDLHGTVEGASLTQDRFGNDNNAYALDGVDDAVRLPRLGLSGDVTISGWLFLQGELNTNALVLAAQAVSGGDRWFLAASEGGLTWFDERPAQGDNAPFHIPVPIQPNTWHHVVAVVADDFPADEKVRLYLDGSLLGAVSSRAFAERDTEYHIGRFHDGLQWKKADGRIDDVRFYDYPLSEQDIQALYQEVVGDVECPVIVTHPQPILAAEDSNIDLTVSAFGQLLSYQWLKDGQLVQDATGPTLELVDLSGFDAGLYAVIAFNFCGSITSNPARVLIDADSDGDGLSDPYEQGWIRYQIVEGSFVWPEAQADAAGRGGHLASITSQTEFDLIESLGLDMRDAFLGGTDELEEGSWLWVTGEPWLYERWASGEPNNAGNNENHLQVANNTQTVWNDVSDQLAGSRYLLEFGFYSAWDNPDTDGDGLNDGAEVNEHNTFPNVSDSDQDGLSDGEEILSHGTDPRMADTDGDGLSDGEEVNQHQSNPLVLDSDGDGLNDGSEVNTYGTNPTLADTDADGFSDFTELFSGKDPLDENDFPDVVLMAHRALEVEFVSRFGDWYQVQISPDLDQWNDLGDPIAGTGELIYKLFSIRDTDARFYRIEIVPEP